ncbi:hypothetical protein DFAR_2720006 [Desulfarculales bacterium]
MEHLKGLELTAATGSFSAMMNIHLVNQGSVILLLLDSDKAF